MIRQYFLPIALLTMVPVGILLRYLSQGLRRRFQEGVLKGLECVAGADSSVLTEKDLRHLPPPLQNYLRYAGVNGRARVQNVRLVFEGEMRLGQNPKWTKVNVEQYDFFDQPTRLFLIKVSILGLPVWGVDSYIAGRGGMLIKVAGLFTVVDAKGPEMDQGELVTLFNDICLLAPAVLTNRCFQWEAEDALTVKGVFSHGNQKVSARLFFNEQGQLINFVTDDRFYSPTGKSYQPVRWSTPVNPSDYREFDGVKVPSYAEAIWHFETGDFCYAKYRLKEIEYNCTHINNSR